MSKRVLTNDEAEWEILSLANEKGKFAIQVGIIPENDGQEALERGIENGWFTLVDVSPIANATPGVLMRIFKLTASGQERRDKLKAVFKPDIQRMKLAIKYVEDEMKIDSTLNYKSYVNSLMSLLDRIEEYTEDETTQALCEQRFQIARDHGLTVRFGEPASDVDQ